MEFLDNWDDADRKLLLGYAKMVITQSAVNEGVILDDDLAYVNKPYFVFSRIAGAARDDIYRITAASGNTGIHFPLVRQFFIYMFAKGVEGAYKWHLSGTDDIDLAYDPDAAKKGIIGLDVTSALSEVINLKIPLMENVFCDFQDYFLNREEFGFNQGGRWLADALASGLFWSAAVGMDTGMNELGYP